MTDALEPGRLALLEADRDDVQRRLDDARSRAQRHALWVVLGMSPAALPALFAISELGVSAILALSLTVFMVEGWRAFTARREVRKLEIERAAIEDRRAELEAGIVPGPEGLPER